MDGTRAVSGVAVWANEPNRIDEERIERLSAPASPKQDGDIEVYTLAPRRGAGDYVYIRGMALHRFDDGRVGIGMHGRHAVARVVAALADVMEQRACEEAND